MNYKKQPYNFDEQIDRLINVHGLTIDNRKRAIEIVKSMNYFTIRGYGRQYIVDNSAKAYKFASGITLEDIYNIYLFDCEFKSKLIYIIGIIEKHIRSEIANLLAVKYSNSDITSFNYYPNTICFSNNAIADEILNKEWLKQKTMFDKHICDEVVYHYMTCHNQKLPIWLLIEDMVIGDLQKLYNVCLFNADAIEIAKSFELDTKHFSNYLEILRKLRNICCHFNRLYGKTNLLIPKPLQRLNQIDLDKWNDNRLESTLIILRSMCKNNKTEWNIFVDGLIAIIKRFEKVIDYKHLKMQEDWFKNIKL